MKNALFILYALFLYTTVYGEELNSLYERLDSVLAHRKEYARQKEEKIAAVRQTIKPQTSLEHLFQTYYTLSEEYYTYRSDSALFYIEKAADIAERLDNRHYKDMVQIQKSLLMATTGYFSQALSLLDDINKQNLSQDLLFQYYTAYEWIYSVWSEYSNDDVFTPLFRKREIQYTDSMLQVLPAGKAEYHYWRGEYLARTNQQEEAEKYYMKALEGLPVNTRLYACVTCGIAFTHLRRGNMKEYEHYLILAAISDMVCPLKENLAMQELAMHIFKTRKDDLARANRYLYYAMEDAMFYNNRLRMLEIAKKYPYIVKAYQEQSQYKSKRIILAFVFICILSVCLAVSLFFIYRQVKQIRLRRKSEKAMNNRLKELNKELITTNSSREKNVSLFLDLCAAYIDKLNRFQELVRRKVKSKQYDDLLKISNSSKMPETEAKQFFVNFDTAFLTLYPHFVDEFNKLLKEDAQITLKRGELLNTELRIFALIRMGIQDSSRIATLLFYSPQTIYNYRTSVKNRALNRETFEEQVKKLCPLVERTDSDSADTLNNITILQNKEQ